MLRCHYSTVSSAELMEHVIPHYRIEKPLQCVFWDRGANDTYQVRCTDTRYSLRVYRHGAFPRESMEFEAAAIDHLYQQGCSVAHPIARESGEFLTEIKAPEGNRFVLLTAFADGTTPDYNDLEQCRLVGESVAQMHQVSNGFETVHKRAHLDLQSLLSDSLDIISPQLAHRPADLQTIEQIAKQAQITVQAAPEHMLEIGFCHGDLHGYNLHLHEGKVMHFDFEECAFGYRAYDLATFKWGACMGEQRASRWSAFVQGYQSVRSIAKLDYSLIDTFVVIRELSNTAFGLRNLDDFGHDQINEGNISHFCRQLERYQALVTGKD